MEMPDRGKGEYNRKSGKNIPLDEIEEYYERENNNA
jgi:hypothetical protein